MKEDYSSSIAKENEVINFVKNFATTNELCSDSNVFQLFNTCTEDLFVECDLKTIDFSEKELQAKKQGG